MPQAWSNSTPVLWTARASALAASPPSKVSYTRSPLRAASWTTPNTLCSPARGARQFALEQGFESVELLTEKQRQNWIKWQEKQHKADNHDTIALLGLDGEGHIAGGCSTSGWGYKLPGRVGDSPIIGSGLYVDGRIGAAGATGLGENVMRYCASFLVVEYMRQGLHPEEACIETIKRVVAADPRPAEELHLNFVALDKKGRYGAAGTNTGFKYSVTYPGYSKVLEGAALSAGDIGPEGGNIR